MALKTVPAALFFGLTCLVLALPASALAQTPTDDIYDPADLRQHVLSSTSSTSTGGSKSGLAFTGLDVGLVVLAGLVILAMGIAIRRAARAD